MSDSCYLMSDSGYLDDVWTSRRATPLADVGTLSEVLTYTSGFFLTDTATLTELYEGHISFLFTDTGVLHEAWVPLDLPVDRLIEVARAIGSFNSTRSAMFVDTATVSEAYAVRRAQTMLEIALVTDVFVPLGAPHGMLVDKKTVTEKYTGTRSQVLADVLTAADGWTMRRGVALVDTATFDELFTGKASPVMSLLDNALATETWAFTVAPTMTLFEEALANDAWMLPGSGTDAWTANTDTFAMSRYSGYGVNSLAEIGGALYGATAAGLCRMDADNDAGTPIEGWILTGRTDMGSEATKHLRMMYAGAETNGALQAKVCDIGRGIVGWHTYLFEACRGNDLATQRAKIGRGMRSRYWQFQVGNVDGAAFTLDTLSFIADIGSRRV